MQHVGAALFWILIGIICCGVMAPRCACAEEPEDTQIEAEATQNGDAQGNRPRPEPMTAGELTAWWEAWDNCEGEWCID